MTDNRTSFSWVCQEGSKCSRNYSVEWTAPLTHNRCFRASNSGRSGFPPLPKLTLQACTLFSFLHLLFYLFHLRSSNILCMVTFLNNTKQFLQYKQKYAAAVANDHWTFKCIVDFLTLLIWDARVLWWSIMLASLESKLLELILPLEIFIPVHIAVPLVMIVDLRKMFSTNLFFGKWKMQWKEWIYFENHSPQLFLPRCPL